MAWKLPTSFSDPNSEWNNEVQAYDENTGTGADSPNGLARTWGSYLELNIDSTACDKIRFYAHFGDIQKISIDVYYASGWHNIFEDAFANQTWEEKVIGSTEDVTKARIRFYAKKADTAYLYEFEFNEISGDFEYIGSGSFTWLGTAIQTHTQDYLYVAGGQFAYAGEAVQSYTFNFSYVGNGQFAWSGSAATVIGFAYLGSGILNYSGVAVYDYTLVFVYTGDGTYIFSGVATQVHTKSFLCTSNGQFVYLGSANCSYEGAENGNGDGHVRASIAIVG